MEMGFDQIKNLDQIKSHLFCPIYFGKYQNNAPLFVAQCGQEERIDELHVTLHLPRPD